MPMENNLQLDNLMKEGTFPVESVGGDRWRILHGDTLQLVQAFQPGIFDALITDPPYLGHFSEEMTKQYVDFMPKRIAKASDAYFKKPGNDLASAITVKKRGDKK